MQRFTSYLVSPRSTLCRWIRWQTNRRLLTGTPYKLRQSFIWTLPCLIGRYHLWGPLNILPPTFWWWWLTDGCPSCNDSMASCVNSSLFGGRSWSIHFFWSFHPCVNQMRTFFNFTGPPPRRKPPSQPLAILKKVSNPMSFGSLRFPPQFQVDRRYSFAALRDHFSVVVNDNARDPTLADCCKSWEFTQCPCASL